MSFRFEPLAIPDVVLVRPTRHEDQRGYFEETYRRSAFAEAGIVADFVQDNFARSRRNVLRGLHYQLPPAAQAKLVGVAAGRVFDVAVDLRAGSATFGRWVGTVLSDTNQHQLWIPPGYAHGYVVLSEVADFEYKCTDYYDPKSEAGVVWNDPQLGIEWPISEPTLSAKDRLLPRLAELTRRR